MDVTTKRLLIVSLTLFLAILGVYITYSKGWLGKSKSSKALYICPMHPTYVSDRPGECPICNMQLELADTQEPTPEQSKSDTSPKQKQSESALEGKYICPVHWAYDATEPGICPICEAELVPAQKDKKYTCPMHSEVVSDKPGRCEKCGMDLVLSSSEPPKDATPKYTCSMHPEVVSDKPGRCEKCGMKLDLVQAISGLTTVSISERGRKLAGIQTVSAVSEKIEYTIRTVGTVVPDETMVRHVHIKISGWIEKLFVNFNGQMVKKGDALLSIYSPELMTNQREFIEARDALQRDGANQSVQPQRQELFNMARKRLEFLDVPEAFILELEKIKTVQKTVTFIAPSTGFVSTKQVFEGQKVEPGVELFVITDISQVWVEADFYEFESHFITLGQEVSLTSPYNPELKLTCPIVYIYPYLNPVSRTIKVRFKLDNTDFRLKLGMYLDVSLKMETAKTVVVPDSAILDSGIRKVVFVEREGHFEPRLVEVGIKSDGKAQILSGINAGDAVVVKGNFLLDSESRLRSAISAKSEKKKR